MVNATVEAPAADARQGLVEWAARIGAVTADALARRENVGLAAARARLAGATRRGDLARARPLAAQPSIFTATHAGLRACGLAGRAPVRVTAANAAHAIACAHVAAALERAYPGHEVLGEPELRAVERTATRTAGLHAARTAAALRALPLPHRPDILLVPAARPPAALAVEVELTVKAPRRLAEICRMWARYRGVAGVVYVAPPPVQRALMRAIAATAAQSRVAVLPIAALLGDPLGDSISSPA